MSDSLKSPDRQTTALFIAKKMSARQSPPPAKIERYANPKN